MPWHLPADRVEPLLQSLDSDRETDTRAAWDWLTASGNAPQVDLFHLEYFLWYQLPAKFLTDLQHRRAVATALADLLSELGHEDAAAVCRGTVTMRVLAEWDRSSDAGHRAFRKALTDSGVDPPDTDAMAWGGYMGAAESLAFDGAAAWLEEAIGRGEFTPGAKGWKAAQAEVVRRFLITPCQALDGRTPEAAVADERREFWALRPGQPLRTSFLEGGLPQLVSAPAVPQGIGHAIAPLLRLLEVAGAKPRLTPSGYLPPAAVRTLARDLGWWREESEPRSEADVYQISTLREFANQAGLVRRAQAFLTLTEVGRRALSDSDLLWERVTRTLAVGDHFSSALRELLLARLLKGDGDLGTIDGELLPLLAEAGWRPTEALELTEEMVSYRLWDAIRPMDLLGMIEVAPWPDRRVRLTDVGRPAALTVLRYRSTAPRQSIL
jgi:hypothetical protein